MTSEIVSECVDLMVELSVEIAGKGYTATGGELLQAAATLLLTRQVWHLRQDISEAKRSD